MGLLLNTFRGMRPRVPDSLLEENEAAKAQNCDFAYGELRNLRGGFLFCELVNHAKSLYTDDGLTFFSWEKETSSCRAPQVEDKHYRMYFTVDEGGAGLYVADRRDTKIDGGEPQTAYKVGITRPASAPECLLLSDNPVNESNSLLSFRFHYELNGVKYQEGAVSSAVIDATTHEITIPSMAAGTPVSAFPVIGLKAQWASDATTIFEIVTTNSSFCDQTAPYLLVMNKVADHLYRVTLSVNPSEANKETRAYLYTYVNLYQEESAPSPATIVTATVLGTVKVTIPVPDPEGYCPIQTARIYRSGTGTVSEELFYVGETGLPSDSSLASVDFIDQVPPQLLAEVLVSHGALPPPDGLTGLISLPNGILMGFCENKIYFSESYTPHAWNPANVKTLPSVIVSAIATGNGAIVTTTREPYAVAGVAPSAMTVERINVDQAGVSRRSIAIVNGMVLYASHDGLVAVSGVLGSLEASMRFFTREVWRALVNEALAVSGNATPQGSMIFAVWDGCLVIFSSENLFTAFMIRFDEAAGQMTLLPDFVARAAVTNLLSDSLYYVRTVAQDTNTAELCQFMGGDPLIATFHSSEKVLKKMVNFGAAQIVFTGQWTFDWWAFVGEAWVKVHEEALNVGTIKSFRLPAGYQSDRYRFSVTGTGRFRELRVAETMRDLAKL